MLKNVLQEEVYKLFLWVNKVLLRAIFCVHILDFLSNRIGGVMVNVLVSSAVDRGFEPQSGQTKDYEIGICCFSAKNASLRTHKNKDWFARNQNNVSEWSDMSTRGLFCSVS